MEAPRVSVICIFYNAERFLAEALDSVLAQDFADFELLLVDDGSSDGGTAIAQAYVRDHPDGIRYLEHPGHANRGMSATRNLGLAHARGEYVAFIDSDDVWRPAKLREQVAILDAYPEAGLVCGAVNYWSSREEGDDQVIPTGHVADGLSSPPETSLAPTSRKARLRERTASCAPSSGRCGHSTIPAPIVRLGTKCPSIMSMWIQSAQRRGGRCSGSPARGAWR